MKVAVVSESPADEMIVRTLAESAFGFRLTTIDVPVRHRGWPRVLQVLPAIISHLHDHTGVQGIIVVVDSDHTPLHTADHEKNVNAEPQCRLCRLRACTAAAVSHLKRRPDLKVALGLAVPAIEAWLLCGMPPHASEAAWHRYLKSDPPPRQITRRKRDLKRYVYGTDRPNEKTSMAKGFSAAQNQAEDLRCLLQNFPTGFGALHQQIRDWKNRPVG